MSRRDGPAARARRRAVFLDRDGVINRALVERGLPHPPATVATLEILDGVAEACADLRAHDFALFVVTNQPDVARGTQSMAVVDAIHEEIRRHVYVDGIYVCAHDDTDGCECRKPLPGLLLAAAHDHDLDLAGSFMVGDRWKDVEAGRRAGCRTAFIDRGYAERRPEAADVVVTGLTTAAAWIMSQVEVEEDLHA